MGVDLEAGSILVLRPYEEVAEQGGETAALLVNLSLRQQYEALYAEVNAARTEFLNAVKVQAKTKRDVEREISLTFTASEGQLDIALIRMKPELDSQQDMSFSSIDYDVVADEKVLAFLETDDFRVAIDDYVKKYNELLSESKYFKKGTFNYYNAYNVAKQLKDNGFFKAKHIIRLNGDEQLEIASEAELEALIKEEKSRILGDAGLRRKFEVLERQIQKNVTLRGFEAYIQNHEELLPELANLNTFKEKLWKSYIKSNYDLYISLLGKMQEAADQSREIQEQAAKEHTLWQAVIDIFNERFVVPFRLEVANKVQVMLGIETVPRLGFVFTDEGDELQVDRNILLESLSTGEKKAFYVLNMLFDIEVRRLSDKETLVVIDDIADSFDYKNKYAIVQYLSDLSEDPCFKLLILTHNFDFYRTIESRKLVKRQNCFMVSKTVQGVAFQEAVGIKNIFVNVWKPGYHTNHRMKICSIPFMRNLIEYTKGEADADYILLTSLLHWKVDSRQITVADLNGVYERLFGVAGGSANEDVLVLDLIDGESQACLSEPDGINFENKVVLAIATRLCAERFMAGKINNVKWLSSIKANQTPVLLSRYREQFPMEATNIKVLQKVMLMTPENIHLNSFMYEPILDMSDQHLRRLYSEVMALT